MTAAAEDTAGPAGQAATGRANQKARTRRAIVDACRELTRSGAEVTMPDVARAAMVSEATAYRYCPDLVTLLQDALAGLWPPPAEALAPVAGSADPAERVGFACAYLIRGVHAYQGSVRAMISHTIVSPDIAQARPGVRFGLIDQALAPFADQPELKRQLAIVVGAEALFALTDLCGLSPDQAIATAVGAASTLTRAAY